MGGHCGRQRKSIMSWRSGSPNCLHCFSKTPVLKNWLQLTQLFAFANIQTCGSWKAFDIPWILTTRGVRRHLQQKFDHWHCAHDQPEELALAQPSKEEKHIDSEIQLSPNSPSRSDLQINLISPRRRLGNCSGDNSSTSSTESGSEHARSLLISHKRPAKFKVREKSKQKGCVSKSRPRPFSIPLQFI